MNLVKLNSLSQDQAEAVFLKCCSSPEYCKALARSMPFLSEEELLSKVENIWWEMDQDHWLEAFKGHPKIGDINSLRKKYETTKNWCSTEQAGVDDASESILRELQKLNESYEKKFGFIFIVCATGKSASQMLNILKARIDNDHSVELKNAATEQLKITKIRLDKL